MITEKPIIILPETVPILRSRHGNPLKCDREEYNIYFENIIFPYNNDYDIQVECRYGRNLGHCWRIEDIPEDISAFKFTIIIFDVYGQEVAQRSCTIEVYSKYPENGIGALFIGDSMTQSEIYLEHIAMKLRGVRFIGTRSYNGIVLHEGRGGWSSNEYINKTCDPYGMSPFCFPVNIAARDYYGDIDFMSKAGVDSIEDTYVYDGYSHELPDGKFSTRKESCTNTKTVINCLSMHQPSMNLISVNILKDII